MASSGNQQCANCIGTLSFPMYDYSQFCLQRRFLTLPVQYAEHGVRNARAPVRLSVCVSRLSTAATVAGGFAAERPAGGRYRSPTAFAVQQVPALSSTCGQRHVESRRRRLKRLV